MIEEKSSRRGDKEIRRHDFYVFVKTGISQLETLFF